MKHMLLLAEFLSTPWAVQQERIAGFVGIVGRWANDAQRPMGSGSPKAMEDDDYGDRRSAWEIRREQARSLGTGNIMVLPLYGTVCQRASMISDWSGGTSTQQFTSAFREAMADDTVGQILIDVDSPGGSVYGVEELAEEIYAARGKKQIVAVANSLAASAAYWIGAAAGEFYCTPGGEVGSIGVWSAHEDWSKYLEEMGVKTTLISAGKFKTEGNGYQPLDADAQAFMQTRVNEYYGGFTKAVAKYRGVPVGQVREGMGQGRVLGPASALGEKMIDGVASFDDTLRMMAKRARTAAPRGASRLAASERTLKILG
jgi:signal peptide peptidase SppA